jgi:Xaa-Pro dipeptidase
VPMNTERAKTMLRDRGVDAVVSSTIENNFYLSGIYSIGQELFPRDHETYVVATADAPDSGTVVSSIGEADLLLRSYPTVTDAVTFGTFYRDVLPGADLNDEETRVLGITEHHQKGRPSMDALAEALRASGADGGTIAVDERGPNRELLGRLGDLLPAAKIIPAAELFRTIRAVKTPEELDRMKVSLRINEKALQAALDALVLGVTEKELKRSYEQSVVMSGARVGFCLVRIGRGIALGQIPAGDVALQPGDTVFFDVGVNYDGYKSDIGRLASFGDPNEEVLTMTRASKAGQQAAIDAMKPGAVASDVFDVAVQTVRDSGIPSYQRQHVGHAIGIEFYDMPVLNPASNMVLEPNMIFEVETPYYRLGVGGAFIEDTVVITDDGSEIITELERQLVVVQP